MNANSNDYPVATHGEQAGYSLDVLLAYEDFSAGMNGLRTFDRLFACGQVPMPPGKHNIWKFDLLGLKSMAKTAAAEASVADMVVISVHAPGNLPSSVRLWLEMWIGQRSLASGGALVLLLDGAGRDRNRQFPAETHLADCAKRAGMDFFVHKVAGRHALDDFGVPAGGRIEADPFTIVREVAESVGARFGQRGSQPLPAS